MALVNTEATLGRKTFFKVNGTAATSVDFPLALVGGDDFTLNGSTGMECARAGRYAFKIDGQNSSTAGTWEIQKNGTNVQTIDTLNTTANIKAIWVDDLVSGDIITIENISGPTSVSYLVIEIEAF